MTAKEYLQQAKDLNGQIINKCEEVQNLQSLATKIGATADSGDRVKSSGSQDKMADAISKIVDLQEEIKADVNRLADVLEDIKETIGNVENSDYRNVLYKRYILFKTWEQIACDMYYSYQWVCKLHGRALICVQELIEV